MRTFFQVLILISFVLFSPVFFILLALRMGAPSVDVLKSQLIEKDVYTSTISALHKQIDEVVTDAAEDDPLVIVGPFIKKELTATYVQKKAETFIDDTHGWIAGTSGEPVLSFTDMKEKLMGQNKNMIAQLQVAVTDMEAQQHAMPDISDDGNEQANAEKLPFSSNDLDAFLKSDFTVPMGKQLGWMKALVTIATVVGIGLGVSYALSLLLLIVLAPSLQSKLRWVGWTFLLTALWNIPGIAISAGAAFIFTKALTQTLHEAVYISPFIETFLTPVFVSYTRIASQACMVMGISAIGMLILSFMVKHSPHITSAKAPLKKKK
jgi:hypothetical protein